MIDLTLRLTEESVGARIVRVCRDRVERAASRAMHWTEFQTKYPRLVALLDLKEPAIKHDQLFDVLEHLLREKQ